MVVNPTKRIVRKVLFWILALVIPKLVIITLAMTVALGAVDEAERFVVNILVRSSGNSGTVLVLEYEVLRWRPVVEYWANHYNISDWTLDLLAIMHVETGGRMSDLMQSSESAGLPPNTLQYEDSIEQGVRYLSRIIMRARSFGIDDDRHAIFQAYNFGIFYINFLAQRGISHNLDISAYYSRTVVAPSLGNVTGQRRSYQNPIAIANGRPWLYANGGNFHYAFIVEYTLSSMVLTDAGTSSGVQIPNIYGLAHPMPNAVVTSEFGPRWGTHHAGIDLVVNGNARANILAAASGVVTLSGWHDSMGNWVIISHNINGQRVDTVYAHLRYSPPVRVGQVVLQGDVIGVKGNTGHSFGAHLHFEVHPGGWHPDTHSWQNRGVNPRDWIDF